MLKYRYYLKLIFLRRFLLEWKRSVRGKLRVKFFLVNVRIELVRDFSFMELGIMGSI